MSRIDVLRANYRRICCLPWDRHDAGPQRVWLAVYDQDDERRLRLRMGLFQEATEQEGRRWHAIDLTDSFADWLAESSYSDYAESYFEAPSRLGAAALVAFKKALAVRVSEVLRTVEHGEDTVVALWGVASLFCFVRISELIPMVEDHIRGRLLVFFPGAYEQDNYRLLDARDGWNYHAVPITASEGNPPR